MLDVAPPDRHPDVRDPTTHRVVLAAPGSHPEEIHIGHDQATAVADCALYLLRWLVGTTRL